MQGSSKHWGVLSHCTGIEASSCEDTSLRDKPLDGRESFKQVKSEEKKNQLFSAELTQFPQQHLRICLGLGFGLGLVYSCLFCGYLKTPYQRVCN